MKNLWIIYLIKNSSHKIIDTPILHSFTNNIDILNEFSKQRKMDLFYIKECEVKKSFIKEYKNKFRNRLLSYEKLYTRNQFDATKRQEITVLTTWEEINKIVLHNDIIFKELSKHITRHSYLLKSDFLLALDTLHYFDVYKFNMGNDSSGWFHEKDNFDESIFNMDFDEFMLYMYFNKWMYK